MKILFNRKSILFVTVLMFSAILIVFSSGSANAVPIWGSDATGELMGSRSSSNPNQIVATADSDWADGGFQISWNITQSGNLWTYNYTLVGDRKELSHFILEVTEDDQPFEFTSDQINDIEGPKTFNRSGGENLPNPIYGVKFDIGGSTTMLYSLTTNRAPVYGVFWAVDGVDDDTKDRVLAYSKALDFSDYKTNESLTATNLIVRPDSVSVSVPEPATMILLGTGLFGLAMVRRRFKK